MNTFDADPKKVKDAIEVCNERIKVWYIRAEMAYQQDSIAVSKDALYRWWQYRQALAEIEGKQTPQQPKDPPYYFGRRDGFNLNSQGYGRPGGDPDEPGPVPRRPLPNAGAGEVELPLPSPHPEGGT
jgi:hypothetical protein